jgi:hypothetical protein
LRIISPSSGDQFVISAEPEWPSVEFRADSGSTPPPFTWSWSLQWRTFSKSGVANTDTNTWDAREVAANLGGNLTVNVKSPIASDSITVKIHGAQPSAAAIHAYLVSKPSGVGLEKILIHETNLQHFDQNGEPKHSFDNGYGIAQLTTPPPTYEQVWNWKLNVDGALVLFDAKRRAAIAYLGQQNRTYTQDQLTREAVCRWNGGAYHVWDTATGWIRNPHILCDTQTGNIGWDLTNPKNTGKTEAVLHERDHKQYSHAPSADSGWRYFGVCYADRILA